MEFIAALVLAYAVGIGILPGDVIPLRPTLPVGAHDFK